MATKKKLLQAAAGTAAAGGAGLDITEVFSTYLYNGTGAAQTITNGVDLAGEGGLVWIKSRDDTTDHILEDTERGAIYRLSSNTTTGSEADSNTVTAFNSNGFSIGGDLKINTSNKDYTSWTFRKAPKFFTCLTYTGNGVAGRTISHDLGTTVGFLVVKRTSSAGNNWTCYHRSLGNGGVIELNETGAASTGNGKWNFTTPTSTEFTVNADSSLNANGSTYVAYLFAHNNSDGEFGPDSDQDIVKCGSYEGNDSDTTEININLGFEPQWLLIKNADLSRSWTIVDVMRGFIYGPSGSGAGTTDNALSPNLSDSEETASSSSVVTRVDPTPTGFAIRGKSGICNEFGTHIYMAIRRGPLATPESSTDVFNVTESSAGFTTKITTGFTVDSQLATAPDQTSNRWFVDRLRGVRTSAAYNTPGLRTNSTSGDNLNSGYSLWWDNTGFSVPAEWNGINTVYYNWRRAPGFYDHLEYNGSTSSAQTISHNLGVVPEMMWVKNRTSGDWYVYHSYYGASKYSNLNSYQSFATDGTNTFWNNTAPTSTNFTVGATLNGSSYLYAAYLFSSLAGVSKVGQYTGNGTNGRVIDCGFTNGSRFILIKQNVSTLAYGKWYVWDSERGIVAGNDPKFSLADTTAQVAYFDDIDPSPSGFIANYGVNDNNQEYVFYAIA